MRTRQWVGVALASMTVGLPWACGGSTSGGGGAATVSGNVAGTTFTAVTQIGINGYASSDTSCTGSADGAPSDCTTTNNGQGVGVALTNRAEATCSLLQSSNPNANFANFAILSLAVTNESGSVALGAHTISSGSFGANATFETSTSTCGEAVNLMASSGTITLTAVSASSVSGTFDVTFGTQGSFSGSFDTPICVLPDGGIASGGSMACQP